jgi:acyl transferase domain-containing protein
MFPWRSFAIGRSLSELHRSLGDSSLQAIKTITQPLRIAMVFTGQGAQWPAMGHELIESFPIYRHCLEQCEQHLRSFGAKWSLLGKQR